MSDQEFHFTNLDDKEEYIELNSENPKDTHQNEVFSELSIDDQIRELAELYAINQGIAHIILRKYAKLSNMKK